MLNLSLNIVLYASDPGLLAVTLASLNEQVIDSPLTLRILINDLPGDADRYRPLLRLWNGNVQCWQSAQNRGFAGGHNFLLRQAFENGADCSIVLNPDVVLERQALRLLVDTLESVDGNCLLSGLLLLGQRSSTKIPAPAVIDSRGTKWTRTCRHLDADHGVPLSQKPATNSLISTSAVTGALLATSQATYEQLISRTGEFFDEDFFAYREDAELGLRAALVGIPSLVLDTPVGTHFRRNPGVTRGNYLIDYLSARNRFLLAAKYGRLRPGKASWTLLRDVQVIVACMTLERQLSGAIIDAMRLAPRMRQKKEILQSIAIGSR